MNNLKDIQTYWETNTIYKEAGIGIGKTLSVLYKGTKAGVTDTITGVKGVASLAKDYLIKPAIAVLPLTALLAAVVDNKIKSPTVVAKNIDKRLLLNSLDTEIAIARRQIAELELKNNKKSENKPYDRFV